MTAVDEPTHSRAAADRARKARGQEAEARAAAFLVDHGYDVHATNVRVGRQELDIVAFDDDVLCFVEVRSRRGTGDFSAKASVSPTKQKNLMKAALKFLTTWPQPHPPCRFDVVADEDGVLELVQHAFAFDPAVIDERRRR